MLSNRVVPIPVVFVKVVVVNGFGGMIEFDIDTLILASKK